MRQMIRYNTTGEVRVIDTDEMVASEFLAHTDQAAPLEDYDLSCELAESDLVDYTVIRADADTPEES